MKKVAEILKRFKLKSNKTLVKKQYSKRLSLVVKDKKYLLIDPVKNKIIRGNVKEISKKLGKTKKETRAILKSRKKVKKGDINYTSIPFDNSAQITNFLNQYEDDTIKRKPKKKVSVKEKSKKTKKDIEVKYIGDHEHSKKFGITASTYQLNFTSDKTTTPEIRNGLSVLFARAVKKQNIKSKDKVRVIIEDPQLSNIISTPLVNLDQFSLGMVESVIQDATESNQVFTISNQTSISFVSVNMFSGNGKKNLYLNIKKNLYNKKSIIAINNTDNTCCARAISLGITRIEKGVKSKEYLKQRNNKKYQLEKAEDLYAMSGVEVGSCGLEEIAMFEVATGYEINVISGDFMNELIYPNHKDPSYEPAPKDKQLYLYHNNNHYDLIASNKVAGFLSKDYFCYQCKKCFKDKNKHNCKSKCNSCCMADCPVLKIPFSERKYTLKCPDCARYFSNPVCFSNHKIKDNCGRSMCDKIFKCHTCKEVFSKEIFDMETHICGEYFCRNCKQKVQKDHKCYLFPKPVKPFSDKYIFFDFESDISGPKHEVNFSVSQTFYDPTPIIHYDIEEFCVWAFDPQHKGYTFIAHNGRGYDYKFIMRWLLLNTTYKPMTIYAGQKLMCFCVNEGLNIRFIDSINFLTMPLANLPKTFGIKELKKGFYPHWFNTLENTNYVGTMPPMASFGYKSFFTKKREEFIKWWVVKKIEGYVWDNEKELRDYCISDVDILRRCMIKFREKYIQIANIDPLQYITVAGVCMAIFKNECIIEDYKQRHDFLCLSKAIMPLDEYAEKVEEFDTEIRDQVFNEGKIPVLSYEDAEWFRGAFFGGRTNACKLLYNFNDNEEGVYSDITSLYPTVNYYDIYPEGHFTKITNITPEVFDNVIKGKYKLCVVECDIVPPDDLYHPVLAEKGEKLFFDLRKKKGKFASPELNIAIRLGYKITKIYEVRYWEKTTKSLFKKYVSKFLKIKQEASGYPDWVKTEEDKDKYIKDYFEGQGILLEKDKIEYNPGLRAIAKLCLNSLWGKFGQRTNLTKTKIISDKAEFMKIVGNPQLTNINWYQIDETKMEISYQVKEEFVKNDFNTNITIALFTTSWARTRLYFALEKLQHQVLYFDTDSVVYVYNPNNPDHNKLNNGDLLGEWTDELEGYKMKGTFASGGPKNYSYEKHKDDDIKFTSKVKGFGLNHEVAKKINHASMIKVIMNREEEENKISVEFNTIKRHKDQSLTNFTMDKRYGFCYDKREILPPDTNGNIDTIPFGFNKNKINWIENAIYETDEGNEVAPSFLSED